VTPLLMLAGVETGNGQVVITEVPEPVSMSILGTGLLGLAFLRRHKTV
jgi:Zn-dependent alcohol dehydrogenase